MRVGFIDLGYMGKPMAENIAGAGFDLTVYDIRKEAVEALEKISKYDHQKTAIDALKYQPIHHPVAAIDMLRESLAVIASTDMKAWVNDTLREIKGEK